MSRRLSWVQAWIILQDWITSLYEYR